jgi:pSer/pThr/pTyr-binding forkhead associated (FHA) protein
MWLLKELFSHQHPIDSVPRQHVLAETSTTVIGRDMACGIILAKTPTTGRRHCELSISDGQLYLEDTKSKHGTFVNGVKVVGIIECVPGDVLRFGTTAEKASFKFVYLDVNDCS